jgi:hypothetical protein
MSVSFKTLGLVVWYHLSMLNRGICFLQVGKLPIPPPDSWLLNGRNFILKDFNAVIISNISWAFPWSCKLSSFKWRLLSQRKYRPLFSYRHAALGTVLHITQELKYFVPVRFQVLMVASMKFRVFWDVASCSHDEVDRHLRGAYCLHHQVHFNVTTWRSIPEDFLFCPWVLQNVAALLPLPNQRTSVR